MTSRVHPLLTTAILALAACGGGKGNSANAAENVPADNAASEIVTTAPANQAATDPTQNAPAAATALTADYMVGKWSAVGEDCSATLEFRKNGTVGTPIGDGKWTVADGKLTIDYHDGSTPTTSAIKPLGADRIEITTSSGRKETEKRC